MPTELQINTGYTLLSTNARNLVDLGAGTLYDGPNAGTLISHLAYNVADKCMSIEELDAINYKSTIIENKTTINITVANINYADGSTDRWNANMKERKRLVPLSYISFSNKATFMSNPATDIIIGYNDNTSQSTPFVPDLNSIILNPDEAVTVWAKVTGANNSTPSNSSVSWTSDDLTTVSHKTKNDNVSYAYVSFENYVDNKNFDNIIYTPLGNSVSNSSEYSKIFATTVDGTNLTASKEYYIQTNVPTHVYKMKSDNGVSLMSEDSVLKDLIVDEEREIIVESCDIWNYDITNTNAGANGAIRGYSTHPWTCVTRYDNETDIDVLKNNFYWSTYLINATKLTNYDFQFLSNDTYDNRTQLYLKFTPKYPTDSLERHYISEINGKKIYPIVGVCDIEFYHWNENVTSTNPNGKICMTKSFKYTAFVPIETMSLSLMNNSSQTTFMFGQDILAKWTVSPKNAWYEPMDIVMTNVKDTPLTNPNHIHNMGGIRFPIVMSQQGAIGLYLKSDSIGAKTATIVAGDMSCSLNYTVVPSINILKDSAKYYSDISFGNDEYMLNLDEVWAAAQTNASESMKQYKPEYIPLWIGADSSQNMCLIGHKIGESNVYIMGLIYDSTTNNKLSPDDYDIVNGEYMSWYTLQPLHLYYITWTVASELASGIIYSSTPNDEGYPILLTVQFVNYSNDMTLSSFEYETTLTWKLYTENSTYNLGNDEYDGDIWGIKQRTMYVDGQPVPSSCSFYDDRNLSVEYEFDDFGMYRVEYSVIVEGLSSEEIVEETYFTGDDTQYESLYSYKFAISLTDECQLNYQDIYDYFYNQRPHTLPNNENDIYFLLKFNFTFISVEGDEYNDTFSIYILKRPETYYYNGALANGYGTFDETI